LINDHLSKIEELLDDQSSGNSQSGKDVDIKIVIDRVSFSDDEETLSRLADSVQTAFFEGRGDCLLEIGGNMHLFCDRFELDGLRFEEPSPNFFSFNNPFGACKRCEGYGKIIGIDEDLVIPDKSKSVYDGAIAPWRGEKMGEWLNKLVKNAHQIRFPYSSFL
jgi:excinuclease ABC subunit A